MSGEMSGPPDARPRRPGAAAVLGMYAEVEGAAADGYVIGEKLPGGGMSDLFLGLGVKSQQSVVLKSVPPEESTPELEARLEREAELLERLAHPDIVRRVDYGMIAGRRRLVMEMVDGETLRAVLRREPGLAGEAQRVARVALLVRVARAVGYAHTSGVAHRDLKPENIMVRPDGGPVVLDFGIVAAVDAAGGKLTLLTRTNVAAGTAWYMAPERAEGREAGRRRRMCMRWG